MRPGCNEGACQRGEWHEAHHIGRVQGVEEDAGAAQNDPFFEPAQSDLDRQVEQRPVLVLGERAQDLLEPGELSRPVCREHAQTGVVDLSERASLGGSRGRR